MVLLLNHLYLVETFMVERKSIFIDTKKCVIVVSPLESLMSDQIKSLEVKGIRSVKLKQVMDEEVQEVRI